jgi:tRNA1Val (adenine37-N6)-methyltransferase
MFRFKQFQVIQDKCAMKVGTDGVLLGAWTKPENAKNILDIGCGSGLLALMLAQKSNAQIDAIDIDKDAYLQSKENFTSSPWSSRLNVYNLSLKLFSRNCKNHYDLIICNPPFFNNSYKPQDTSRSIARHSDQLPMEELFFISSQILDHKGMFNLILPFNLHQEITELAHKTGFHLSAICKIKPKPDKPVNRLMYSLKKTDRPLTVLEEELIIEEGKRHQYSQKYIELTKDYYLNF